MAVNWDPTQHLIADGGDHGTALHPVQSDCIVGEIHAVVIKRVIGLVEQYRNMGRSY